MSGGNVKPGGMMFEAAIQKTTFVTAQAAGAATAYFGLTLNELGVVAGIITGFSALAINAFFQWRRDRREERAARLAERRRDGLGE